MPDARLVGVVVVTHNSAGVISDCLASLESGMAGVHGYELVDYWLPEPATPALLALALAALALARYCSFARSIL